jgi:F5/8 type C domain
VATQGLAKSAFDYVTRFDLIHSTNGRVWERVASSEEDGSFTGNTDSSTAVKHVLPKPILTRYLRFVVRSWSDKGSIGLRVEAYGPGRGSGCLLKCFATNLARNSRGVDLDAALMAVNTANNAIFVHNEGESAFLETSRSEVEANANADAAVAAETTAMTTVEVLADLAVQADAEVSKLVSCCGCSCCETVDPGSCARRYRHYGSKSSSSSSSNSRQLSQRDEEALSESVRTVLRGKDGHSKKAGAHKKKVAGAVTVPDSKRTFYIVEKE